MGGAPPPGLAEREPTPPSPTLQPFCTFFPTEPPTATTAPAPARPLPHPRGRLLDDPPRAGLARSHGANRVPSASGSPRPGAGELESESEGLTHTGTATPRRDPRAAAPPAAAALLLAVLALALAACGSRQPGRDLRRPGDPDPGLGPGLPRSRGPSQRAASKKRRSATGARSRDKANPFAGLVGALQTPGSPALDYGRDVEPWLGRHAAIFLTSLHGTDAHRAGPARRRAAPVVPFRPRGRPGGHDPRHEQRLRGAQLRRQGRRPGGGVGEQLPRGERPRDQRRGRLRDRQGVRGAGHPQRRAGGDRHLARRPLAVGLEHVPDAQEDSPDRGPRPPVPVGSGLRARPPASPGKRWRR